MTEPEENFLNGKELKYLTDKDFLLSKHEITNKIIVLLQEVELKIAKSIEVKKYIFPDGVLLKTGKISKGENYRLLPYLILDYPRQFNTQAIFAFRSMFWWGNFLSCTFHLQGTILNHYRTSLHQHIDLLKNKKIFIGVGESPWEYHYGSENYLPVDQLDQNEVENIIKNKKFVKLSRFLEIEEHHHFPEFAEETFNLMMRSINVEN